MIGSIPSLWEAPRSQSWTCPNPNPYVGTAEDQAYLYTLLWSPQRWHQSWYVVNAVVQLGKLTTRGRWPQPAPLRIMSESKSVSPEEMKPKNEGVNRPPPWSPLRFVPHFCFFLNQPVVWGCPGSPQYHSLLCLPEQSWRTWWASEQAGHSQ